MTRARLSTLKAAIACLVLLTGSVGCSQHPTAIVDPPQPPPPLPASSADQMARDVGEQWTGANGFAMTRALVSFAISPAQAHARTARPTRAGTLTAANGSEFNYDLQAYDRNGAPVPWDTTDLESIWSLVVKWNLTMDEADAESGSYYRGHMSGRFEVAGVAPSSPEWQFDGAAADTLDYRAISSGFELSASGIVDEDLRAIRVSKDSALHPYPLAGSYKFFADLRSDLVQDGKHQPESYRANAELTFDGTVWAQLVIAGQYRYRLNLDTGEVESAAGV